MGATLSWDTTRVCNLGCTHCSNADDRASAAKDLALTHAAHVFAEFRAAGGVGVHFLGGEPLLRKDLLSLAYIASELGLVLGVTTNGWMVPDEEGIEWIVRRFSSINVSLDGASPGVNDAIRGVGTFDHAMAGLRAYLTARNHAGAGAAITISHTLCASNAGDVAELIRLASELSVDSVSISVLKPYGNAARSAGPTAPSSSQYFEALEVAAALAGETRVKIVLYEVPERVKEHLIRIYGSAARWGGDEYCDAGEGQLRMSSDGFVYPCFAGSKHLPERRPQELQAADSALPKILDSDVFRSFPAEAHAKLRATPWAICQGCDFFHNRQCYPGCPYASGNLKPQLCELLAARERPE